MTDQPYGLGAVPSPPDARDFPITALYAATATEIPTAFPAAYIVPGLLPAVLDQGSTPQCVAFSSSASRAYQDRLDQGVFFDFDEGKFFGRIGGTEQGAYPRAAMDEMRTTGYPVVVTGDAGQHRIAAYYAVPTEIDAMKAALVSFGPLVYSTGWYWSWFSTTSTGLLRAPTTLAGGHAILVIGWEPRGFLLQNSWGTDFGIEGRCTLPWEYVGFPHSWECWKTVDVIEPPVRKWSIRIAAGTTRIRYATLSATRKCIAAWTYRTWSGLPSSAPCEAPVTRPGCSSGAATTALVTAGAFAGKHVWIGGGVTSTGG